MADVFGVVVAYNNAQLTVAAVKSILKSDHPVRLVVWDNASSDDTLKQLEQFGDSIIVHASSENLYWSPALVASVNEYWNGEEYLAFFNNDLVVHPNSISRMLKVFDISSKIAVVVPYGSALGGDQDFAYHAAYKLPNASETDMYKINHAIANWAPKKIDAYVGACTLMSKATWDDTGGLDPKIPMADDYEYMIRLKKKGYEAWLASNAYIKHVGHASGDDKMWGPLLEKSWERIFELHDLRRPGDPLKLNLGCGNEKRAGYVGIDIVPTEATDLVMDIRSLDYEDNTVDEIFCSQVIEHFFPNDFPGLFIEWFRVLKPGGSLYLDTPDFEYVAKEYVAGRMGIGLARAYVNGTIDDLNSYVKEIPESYHRTVWDANDLKYNLSKAGFKDIATWSDGWTLQARAYKN